MRHSSGASPLLLSLLVVALSVLASPARGQIVTPCSASMISSFTPCFNFVTNSSSNGTSPTSDCCNSIKSLANTGMSCLCLIVTGSVPLPFQIPINRTLAIGLPRACNMPGVPVQCRASGAPIPAPGPGMLGPTLSPASSPSASPKGSTSVPGAVTPSLAPEADTPPVLTSPPPSGASGSPANSTPGSRPVVNPSSAAGPSHAFSPASLLIVALGFAVGKLY